LVVSTAALPASRIQIRTVDSRPAYANLAQDVKAGLSAENKQLPPKYFYDAHGSELFDQICNTREYYPTRIENGLLARYAPDIIQRTCPELIVELGSGSSRKTIHLLDACDQLAVCPTYQPVDICREMLLTAGTRLLQNYDWLEIEGVVGDYCENLSEMPAAAASRLFVFLGGTLGNFDEQASNSFLRTLYSEMGRGDWLLVGVDRIKAPEVLHAAYNDAEGYTAAFNRNVLSVINRELDGQFDLHSFEHHACFNEARSRIEMHLKSTVSQKIRIKDLDMEIEFSENETILTEISRKFTSDSLSLLLRQNGFELVHHYQPDNGYFSLVLAKANAIIDGDR